MKKFFIFLICVIITVSLLPSCKKQESKLTLTVGLEEDLLPYCYIKNGGGIDGFYVRALKKIALEAGFVDVKFIECKNGELMSKLLDGEVDCFASKSDKKYDTLLKSDCFFYSDSAFIILSDSEYASSKTIEDVKNAKLCSLSGSVEEPRFELHDVSHFETLSLIKEKLDSGEFDGFSGDYFVARAFRLKINEKNLFKHYPDSELNEEDYCHYLYFKDDNNEPLRSLNCAIASFTLDDASEIAEEQMKIIAEKN